VNFEVNDTLFDTLVEHYILFMYLTVIMSVIEEYIHLYLNSSDIRFHQSIDVSSVARNSRNCRQNNSRQHCQVSWRVPISMVFASFFRERNVWYFKKIYDYTDKILWSSKVLQTLMLVYLERKPHYFLKGVCPILYLQVRVWHWSKQFRTWIVFLVFSIFYLVLQKVWCWRHTS